MSGSSAILGSSRGVSDGIAKLSLFGLIVGLVAGVAQIAAGPGRQFGLWDHIFGFKILEWAAYAGLAAAGASLIGVFFAWGVGRQRLIVMGVIGTVIGALVAYWPWALQRAFREPPPLYDITTDTANPPRFVAALDLRKVASRLPSEYPANFASQQLKAYPDLRPVVMRLPPDETFSFALRLARATRGWTVHAAVPAEGRIEAVAKTLWFGFEDDVVIRVVAVDGGSRVDVRSTGRLARRDGGTNARRVQAFLKKLNAAG
jgi:uncharacterized protein (DUF1499 family)